MKFKATFSLKTYSNNSGSYSIMYKVGRHDSMDTDNKTSESTQTRLFLSVQEFECYSYVKDFEITYEYIQSPGPFQHSYFHKQQQKQ